MGNCLKRETGFEIEDNDISKKEIEAINNNIAKMKERWKNDENKIKIERLNWHQADLQQSMNEIKSAG